MPKNKIHLNQNQISQIPSGEVLLPVEGVPEGYEFVKISYLHVGVKSKPYSAAAHFWNNTEQKNLFINFIVPLNKLHTPLWVQEEWRIKHYFLDEYICYILYRDNEKKRFSFKTDGALYTYFDDYNWQPADTMPQAFSRSTVTLLEIVDVVEKKIPIGVKTRATSDGDMKLIQTLKKEWFWRVKI